MNRLMLLLGWVALSSAAIHAEDAYTRLGFPPYQRPWQASDYQRVSQLLSSGQVKLWRYDDPLGAKYLARLTAMENLGLYTRPELPLETRLQMLDVTVMKAVGQIAGQYVKQAQLQPAGSRSYREMIQLHAYTLRIMELSMLLVEQLLPAIPRDEPGNLKIRNLQASLLKTGDIFRESIGLASEIKIMPAQDITFLLRSMQAVLPILKRGFTPDFKLEARKALQANRPLYWNAADLAAVDAMLVELGK